MNTDQYLSPYPNKQLKASQPVSALYGMNTRTPSYDLPDNLAQRMDNCVISSGGTGIRTRYGSAQVGALPALGEQVISCFHGAWNDGSGVTTRKVIIGTVTGALHYGTGSAVTDAWTSLLASAAGSKRKFMSWAMYGNYVLVTNAAGGNVKKISAAYAITDIDASAPLTAQYVYVWNDYVFLAGVPTAPQTLYYSEKGSVTAWDTTAQAIDVGGTQDGDPIVGITSVYGRLIILKRNSIWALSGTIDDEFELTKVSDIGCVVDNCFTTAGASVYFLASGGIYEITPELSVVLKTNGNTPVIQEMVTRAQTSGDVATYSFQPSMAYDKNYKYVMLSGQVNHAFPFGTEVVVNKIAVIDLLNQGPSGENPFYLFSIDFAGTNLIYQMAQLNFGGTQVVMFPRYLKSDGTQTIVKFTTPGAVEFSGNAITGTLRTKYYNLGDSSAAKIIRYLNINMNFASTPNCYVLSTNTPWANPVSVSAAIGAIGPIRASVGKSTSSPRIFFALDMQFSGDIQIVEFSFEYIYLGRRIKPA